MTVSANNVIASRTKQSVPISVDLYPYLWWVDDWEQGHTYFANLSTCLYIYIHVYIYICILYTDAKKIYNDALTGEWFEPSECGECEDLSSSLAGGRTPYTVTLKLKSRSEDGKACDNEEWESR